MSAEIAAYHDSEFLVGRLAQSCIFTGLGNEFVGDFNLLRSSLVVGAYLHTVIGINENFQQVFAKRGSKTLDPVSAPRIAIAATLA